MHMMLISIPSADGKLAAPFWSLGHDSNAALSHAKFSLINHYAFGQLKPLDQARIPHPLYATLNDNSMDKRKMLEEIVASANDKDDQARIEFGGRKRGERYQAEIFVSGGKFLDPIRVTATGDDKTKATNRAIRRLLRNDVYSSVASYADPRIELYPKDYLSDFCASRGWKMEEIWKKTEAAHSTKHEATITIQRGGPEDPVIGRGTGSRLIEALNSASIDALKQLGQFEGQNRDPHSWSIQDHASHARQIEEENAGIGKGGVGPQWI